MKDEMLLKQLNYAQLIAFFRMLVNERFDLDDDWTDYIQRFDEYKKWVESYQLSMTILTDDQWNLVADEQTMTELFKEKMDGVIEGEEIFYQQLLSDWNHYIQQAEYYLQVAIDPELKHAKPNFFQRLYRVITRRRRYEIPYELKAEMLAPYEETPRDYVRDYNDLIELIEDPNMLQALANLNDQALYIVQQMDESEKLLEERKQEKDKIEPKVKDLYRAYHQWQKSKIAYEERQHNGQDLEYYIDESYRDLSIYMEGLDQLDKQMMIEDLASLDRRFAHFHYDPLSNEKIDDTKKINESGKQIRQDLVNSDNYTRQELIELLKQS